MRKLCVMLVCTVGFCAATIAVVAPADARRFGGARVHAHGHGMAHTRRAYRGGVNQNRVTNRNINRNVNVNRNVSRRYVYRNGQRGYWRNGLWVVAPAAAGYVASCAYEYNRWQSTGSTYWRDRYYQCTN